MSENKPCLKGHVAFARTVLASALFLIAATLVASVFATNIYAAVCICTVNYLAYSWIAMGIAALLSLVAQVTAISAMAGECKCEKHFWQNLLMWLQAAALLAGIILAIVFIARLTEVI